MNLTQLKAKVLSKLLEVYSEFLTKYTTNFCAEKLLLMFSRHKHLLYYVCNVCY